MTTDLDSRLNLAASSLRRSVADLPIGEPRRPGRSPMALGLVVLLVAGVLAATIVVRSGDGATDLEVTPAAEVHALIAGEIPDGLAVAWAGEQSALAAAGGEAGIDTSGDATTGVGGPTTAGPVDLYTYIYGDTGAGVPFETSDLVVNVWDSSIIGAGVDSYGDADIAAAGLDTIAVRDHEGMYGQTAGLNTVRWYEGQDLEVVLASRSLSPDQLLAIAGAMTVDGTDIALGRLPAGLPGPLDQVAALGGQTVAGARATTAKWVGYAGGTDLSQVVDITTLDGGADELMALVWELGATQPLTVRGQQGYMSVTGDAGAAAGAGPMVQMVWQEASGALAHVTAIGLSQQDVLAIVEGLHPSTGGEWATVTDLAATAQAAAAGAAAGAPDAAADAGAEAGAAADVTGDAAGAAGSVTDAATEAIAELESTLHDDLGGAAIVGTAGSALAEVGGGLGDVTGSAGAGDGAEGQGVLGQ